MVACHFWLCRFSGSFMWTQMQKILVRLVSQMPSDGIITHAMSAEVIHSSIKGNKGVVVLHVYVNTFS